MDIVRISDGLGNQIFQYAYAKAHAIKTGRLTKLDTRYINNEEIPLGCPGVLARHNGLRKFGLYNYNISLDVADENELQHWDYLYKRGYAPNTVSFLSQIDLWPYLFCREDSDSMKRRFFPTYFTGYYFDLRYYNGIREVLQKEITLGEDYKFPPEVSNILKEKNTVAVHARRSDFLLRGRDISSTDYYKNALDIIYRKIKDPFFLVFSDDKEWVNQEGKLFKDMINVSSFQCPDYIELIMMKQCNHFVIANSTFSYWAAYLSESKEKNVICPLGWRTSIIPDDWIKCELREIG